MSEKRGLVATRRFVTRVRQGPVPGGVTARTTATEQLHTTAEEFTARDARACPGFVRTPLTEGLVTLAQADDDVLTEHLPADMSIEQMQPLWTWLKRGIATMMEPQVATERIIAAVEADRLYALTHGALEDGVRHRAKGILAALGDRG